MDAGKKSHPYHMVAPSKWPFLSTFGLFVTAIGAVLYMQGELILYLLIGIATTSYAVFGWWRDVVRESRSNTSHTIEVGRGLRIGVVLFIMSEVMFFFAFFWAYANSSIPLISQSAHSIWPPKGIIPLDPFGLPLINTIILLVSGGTVTYAHHMIKKANYDRCADGLFLTVILGVIFSITQLMEYGHATFGLTDGIYPSTFYLATGFHGFHVFVGTVFLAVCYWRCKLGHFTAKKHIGLEAAAWYWHFVDVVWVLLFGGVYWWGSLDYFNAIK